MKNPADLACPFAFQNLQGPPSTLPRMDQQRFIHLASQPNHLHENLFLPLPGCLDLTIKTDFSEGNGLRVFKKLS